MTIDDMDGDGDDELAVLFDDGLTCGAHLQRGSASGPVTTPDIAVTLPSCEEGTWLASAGDLDGDGRVELALLQPYADGGLERDGRVDVYRGEATGFATEALFSLTGNVPQGDFGASFGSEGDLDGDGYDDLVTGGDDLNRVLVTYGLGSTPDTHATWTTRLTHLAATAGFGTKVAHGGDVNGDGYQDLVVTAPGEGELSVFHGGATGLAATPAMTMAPGVGTYTGVGGITHADLDGDGYGDLLVGHGGEYDDDGIYAGAVYLYTGTGAGISDIPSQTFWGSGGSFGSAIALGDFNDDGWSDMAVGSPYYSWGFENEGAVSVFLGTAAGLPASADWSWDADAEAEYAGTALAVGDLDGDGNDDLVVGAPGHQAYEYDEGAMYVFAGGSAGLGSAPDWTVACTAASARCGSALVVADIDQDGFDDAVLGAPGYDGAETDEGGALVYRGGAAGPDDDPAFTWSSGQEWAAAGGTLALDDIDGDGDPDLVIGAASYDASGSNAGEVWVIVTHGEIGSAEPHTLTTWSLDQGFGITVAIVDVDGDGHGELAVGAPGQGGGTGSYYDPGNVYLWDLDDSDADGDFDGSDCQAADPSVHAGAAETCGGLDNDCDGVVDEDTTWYLDGDGDGYGHVGTPATGCALPSGYVATSDDCDDSNAGVHPGVDETCDGTDEDCDGLVDEEGGLGEVAFYADGDGDGLGNTATLYYACSAPTGMVAAAGDCDDDDVAEGSAVTWYADADGDGYGNGALATTDCDEPLGYVLDGTDCDDDAGGSNPGATETCNGLDDDCDGHADEDVVPTWYGDADGDGHGGVVMTAIQCEAPGGYVATGNDCDDSDAAISPSATERCDGVDEDCDGEVDEGATSTFYVDADSDGYGDLDGPTADGCTAPSGYSNDALDCDDTAANVHPGAPEVCNEVDDDCDGVADPDDAVDAPAWYVDGDGDGYGDGGGTASCDPIAGSVVTDGDCNDADATVSPGAAETWYDGIDQDCDGADDDQDGDGYGVADDCDDTESEVNPGADESWYDDIDQDCAGDDDFDADGDGQRSATYGGPDCDDADPHVYDGAPDAPYDGVVHDCASASDNDADGDGYDATFAGGDDCDDARGDTYPGAVEVWYDGIDQDCDGNDGDQDGDGFALPYDCDDGDPAINADADEVLDNDVDEDCDGQAFVTPSTTEPEDEEDEEDQDEDTATKGVVLEGCGGCGTSPQPPAWIALATAWAVLGGWRNSARRFGWRRG